LHRAHRPTFVVYSRLDAGRNHAGALAASAGSARTDRGGRPLVASANAASSAARKRWAFRILFELPTGEVSGWAVPVRPRLAASVHVSEHAAACMQTTEMNCAGSLSVAQVKDDVHRQWAATQRA
jgi:hypothetical protein